MQSKTWGGARLVRVAVVYKHTKYDLKLDRKVTRIIGDSGTGKTTLATALNSSNEGVTKIKVLADEEYVATSMIPAGNQVEFIKNSTNTVFILDESVSDFLYKSEVQEAILSNQTCYFIILDRCSRIPAMEMKLVTENGIHRLKEV